MVLALEAFEVGQNFYTVVTHLLFLPVLTVVLVLHCRP